ITRLRISSVFPYTTLFRSYFSVLPIAVFVVNKDGEIVFCNERFLATMGHVKESIHDGLSLATSGSPYNFKNICREVIAALRSDDTTVSVTDPLTQKRNYYKLSARLFLDKYVLFSATDQTDKVELEQMIEKKKR